MDDDTLEILQFIYMAATAATFLFNTRRISQESNFRESPGHDTKKGISCSINMHEIDVRFFFLISIPARRFMSVSTGNI